MAKNQIRSKPRVTVINAMAELERVGYKYEPAGDAEVQLCCPVHKDSSPSVGLNTEQNVFRCRAAHCGASGDIITLLVHILNQDSDTPVTRAIVTEDLSKRYENLYDVKALNPTTIEGYHDKIWDGGPLLSALRARGVTDEAIRYARIGINRGRITIPIRDTAGRYINIRSYLPGAPGPQKFRNLRSYGGLVLYQPEDVEKYDDVWVCGGEMKSLAAKFLLNSSNVGACSVTGGEGTWDHSFNVKFKGKRVFICMDIDAGGTVAARTIARYLYHSAESIRIVNLPLDKVRFPKGDLSDYVGDGMEAGTAELLALMAEAEEFIPEDEEEVLIETKKVSLAAASDSENVSYRVEFSGIVSALHETPFIVPRVVSAMCDRKQKHCTDCPIYTKEPDDQGRVELTIHGTSPGILEMVAAGKQAQSHAIREALRVPACKSVAFSVREHRNVCDVRLSPELSIESDNQDYVIQPAMICDHKVDLNTPYRFSGRVYPNPKNQEAMLIIDEVDQGDDNLRSFDPDPETLSALEIFQPEEWTADSIQAKLDDIYADFECNVTRIFQRRSLHAVIDLAYHSVLNFDFDGRMQNGWLNALIVGDSAQGKSETSIRMKNHYGLGERVECKNSSVAGLIGGVQQLGNRWFITWGVIPFHDRRLLFLEEIKGTSTEVIGKLTDMRSSGVAEISKIEKRKAHARTRLVMISNPRSDKPVASYNFGVDVIPELIGGMEDVRRFDIATVVSSSQVDPAEINRLARDRSQVDHAFTGDLCKRLILWSWTRTGEEVLFEDGAIHQCVTDANRLTGIYSDALPLIDRGTTRIKIARLAAALAARTFSHKDYGAVWVRVCHVQFVVRLLEQLYNDPAFGYKDFSSAQKYATTVLDPKGVEARIRAVAYPRDFVANMLHRDEVTLIDFQDWCETDRDDAARLLSFLVRKHALTRERRWYVKTAEFITLLKKMKEDNLPEQAASLKGNQF
ncbi:MAG: hypothetical protein COA69_09680 [Robiginitomaculum sp.]|nr:MAG: hypothetical protein COA69_09680 [Robiginitomaculum sp.]